MSAEDNRQPYQEYDPRFGVLSTETPDEPVFDRTVVVYLDPEIKDHYEPQEEKLKYYIWLAKTVQFLAEHRTSPHRLWVQVGGIGLGNELQVAAKQLAEHEHDYQFGVMGVDYIPQVVENVRIRASKERWETQLVHADLTLPHTYWEQFMDPAYPQSRPVILTAYSSMLHEARNEDILVLQHTLKECADGAGIFIREFEPTRVGTAKMRLKSEDAKEFYVHFKNLWRFHEGEEIFIEGEDEVVMTERLAREFWLHYRNWRKNVIALKKSGRLTDPYKQIHKWPELQEGYVNHRDTTDGIDQFAQDLISELYVPDTHTIISFARTVSDTSDDALTQITDHIELLEQDEHGEWVATPRLNQTRRMWIYLHYVPIGREDEFPSPRLVDEAIRPLAE